MKRHGGSLNAAGGSPPDGSNKGWEELQNVPSRGSKCRWQKADLECLESSLSQETRTDNSQILASQLYLHNSSNTF
jgi:hypothetical protein